MVARVIGELIEMGYSAREMELEFVISPGNRVDIALPDLASPLLVEVKGYEIRSTHIRQGLRYLAAARERWPGKDPRVVLVAPSVHRLVVEPPGLIVASLP